MDPQLVIQPPLNTLPPEVLGKIFMYALQHPEEKRLGMPNPSILCSVCSKWRDIALSTPQLWTRVVATILSGISSERAERKVALLNAWIGRSGTLPLTLYLRHGWRDMNNDKNADDPVVLFIDALTRHASRWEAVYFDFIFPRRHLTPFYTDFPFISWSSLRRISSSSHFASLHHNKSVPWSQITHFTIEADMSPQVALDIFERCPHLLEARIKLDSTHIRATPRSTPSPIIQHGLHKLDLMSFKLELLLSAITLPSLTDLKLTLLAPNSEEANHLINLMTRSRCKLDKLVFSGIAFSADDMAKCLEHDSCISLTELTIEYTLIMQPRPQRIPAITGDILQKLTLHPSNPAPLCPNLTYMRFHKCDWDSLDTVVDMVSSRLCPVEVPGLIIPRMRHLHVEVQFHHELAQRLSEVAQKSGLNYASGGDSVFFTFVASREAIAGNVGPAYPHPLFFLL
ncbi:hypothetical protein AX14_001903 [Amanita brunnescens Koide BX004]|nr:hypothetical protein AX14_001903 [Amanita brunnescens Koide BX004]